MRERPDAIAELVLAAARRAQSETGEYAKPESVPQVVWPINCVVGPGLEGAIACESRVGYVNGSKGSLTYRGYDIFDLCAYSTFEEVAYLLLHGSLPTSSELATFRSILVGYRALPRTLRRLMSFPVETMRPMAALRLGANLLHQEWTISDRQTHAMELQRAMELGLIIGSDEDSIPMETQPAGSEHAVYEFKRTLASAPSGTAIEPTDPTGWHACYHLISGLATIAAAISRVHAGLMPIDPDPELSHAANYLYMLTGRRPTPVEERIMDVCLMLHADHGMNASTFTALVVASTQADMYFSVGAAICALSGPLHGGANALSLQTLSEIGHPDLVDGWYKDNRAKNERIPGFGHRVYKMYDPRARVLAPLAKYVVQSAGAPVAGADAGDLTPAHTDSGKELALLFATAEALETRVVSELGRDKSVFPNVDFYSGLVYKGLGIPPALFTPCFAVSRVAGWTARAQEYLENNRIFRPRAVYTGPPSRAYVPMDERVE